MSNLKNNFASKLTSVVKTSAKRGFVYTASFEDGTTGVIRTSGREYVSVTQISTWYDDGRTDFLFSSKPSASLGKNEQSRVITTVQVKTGAPAPVAAMTAQEVETANAIKADKVWQAKWEAAWPQHAAQAPEPVVNLSPLTNALATIKSDLAEQHRLEHSGDGDCDRHPLG